jgi:hypothetical protein
MFPVALPSPYAPAPTFGPDSHGQVTPVSAANFMPSNTSAGRQLSPLDSPNAMARDYPRQRPMLTNPRLAPSTVTTERALEARTLLAPQFQQNVMATRMARTSNLMADAPRFRNQLDILA